MRDAYFVSGYFLTLTPFGLVCAERVWRDPQTPRGSLCWALWTLWQPKRDSTALKMDFNYGSENEYCTIASKINGTRRGVYLPISKLHSILAVANLLAHNNISQICYCGQNAFISNFLYCRLYNNLTPFGGNIYFAGDGTSYFCLFF